MTERLQPPLHPSTKINALQWNKSLRRRRAAIDKVNARISKLNAKHSSEATSFIDRNPSGIKSFIKRGAGFEASGKHTSNVRELFSGQLGEDKQIRQKIADILTPNFKPPIESSREEMEHIAAQALGIAVEVTDECLEVFFPTIIPDVFLKFSFSRSDGRLPRVYIATAEILP